jgi:hypothetical protein
METKPYSMIELSNDEFEKYLSTPLVKTIRSSILDEANGIVNGARANVYGGPEDSFRTIGGLWGVYLGKEISPADVAAMLALMKVARIRQSPDHRDSWVDIAGYAACGAECGLK